MSIRHPALNQRQLAFRKFALRDLSRPALLAKDLSQDPAQDFLALSLGSFEHHLELAEGLHRQSGERIALQAGYIDCARPDARSAERDGVHLIAFHVGLGAAAFEFSLFCLSQSTVLMELGDSMVERNPEAPDGYPPGFWMRESGAILGRDAFLQTASSMTPQNPRRYEVAVFLTVLMMRFVWFHELYHAVNGHVGLIDGYGLSLGFGETDNAAPSMVGSDTLSLLELDADQSALHGLCNVVLAGIENIEGLRHLAHDEHLRLSLFAAYASTWMLDEYLLRGTVGVTNTHPAPAVRRQNLIRSYASTVAPHLANARQIHDAVLAEMTALSNIIPRFPSGHQLRSEMQNSALQADLDSAQIALERLRGDLVPFRFS